MTTYFKVLIVMPDFGVHFDNAIRARVSTISEVKRLVERYTSIGACSFKVSKVTIDSLDLSYLLETNK